MMEEPTMGEQEQDGFEGVDGWRRWCQATLMTLQIASDSDGRVDDVTLLEQRLETMPAQLTSAMEELLEKGVLGPLFAARGALPDQAIGDALWLAVLWKLPVAVAEVTRKIWAASVAATGEPMAVFLQQMGLGEDLDLTGLGELHLEQVRQQVLALVDAVRDAPTADPETLVALGAVMEAVHEELGRRAGDG